MLAPTYVTICHENAAVPALCEKLIRTIQNLRVKLQAQYERRFPGQSAKIRHAIKEAEALAWSTAYPHLFLPDFAEIEVTRLVSMSHSTEPEVIFAQAA